MIELIKKFLNNYPILCDYIDFNDNISKSYLKNNKWNMSRCRIDVSLFSNVILDYILTTNSSNPLTEKYLEITRVMNKNFKEYKNSNGQDVSALVKWFHIKKIKNFNDKLDYKTLTNAINEYIKIVLENDELVPQSLKNKYYEYIKSEITNNNKNQFVCENSYSETNINVEDIVSTNKNWTKKIDYNLSNDISTVIGNYGEEISYAFLCSKFGKENVEWISKDNKYSDHDFRVYFNNQMYYIETKSTTKPIINFYISRNEYWLYNENQNNYWLLFITNINLNKEQKPIIKLIQNPSFKIMMDEYGYDKNEQIFKIMPTKFIG